MATMVGTMREQLLAARQQTASFEGIVADYMNLMHRIRELEVRNAQLDREAGELRLENDTLLSTLDDARRGTVSSAELDEVRSSLAAAQSELLSAYKERGEAAEAKSKALEQLEVVRDNYAKQSAELEGAREEERRLRAEVQALREEVARMEAARNVHVKELQARQAEAQKAVDRASSLEDENRDLVERLLQMKDVEVQRMNEMNRLREDMLNDAKRQAAEILAVTRAQVARQAGSAAVGVLDASMRSLNIAAEAIGGDAVPAVPLRTVPGVHRGGCFAAAFDVAGGVAATCGCDKLVRLWDVMRCTETATLRGAHEGVNDVAFTCDSRLVLGAEDHNAVRVWEARTGKLLNIALTGHRGKVSGVAASPTDPKMAVSCSSDRSIKVWKLDRGVCERSLHFTSTARRVTTMADNGNVVLSGHFDGRLRFWDLRAKHSEPVHEVELHTGKEIYSTTASAGGGLVVTVGRDNAVSVVDTRTFSLRSRLSAPTFEAEAWATPAINPSATHVAAGSKDGTLFLWEIASSKPSPGGAPTGAPSSGAPAIVRLRQPKSTSREQQGAAVVACAWSPAGLPLVTGDRLGGVTFWGESGS